VVGDGGLAATFKRIPHIVTLFQANSITCVKASQPASATKEQLVEADQVFRRELQKKNQAAKAAKAGAPPAAAPAAGTLPPAVAPKVSSKAPPPAVPNKAPDAAANGPNIPKRQDGPTRPPGTIEDFLWNLHCVLEAYGGPLPIDQLKEAYSKHLGHKCAIERFLVVGDVGLAGTLKRIPHVVSVTATAGGQATCTPTLPKGSTRETLVQADLGYREKLKAKSAESTAATKAAPPAAQAKAPTTAAPAAAPTAAGQTRPAEGGGEPDAKKQKTGADADTLSRMLVQGVVRVLQHRAKEGKGPLLVNDLAEEFKTLWKVPFNLASAGYTDVNTFLKAWPSKVTLTTEASGDVVSLAKKAAEKAKSEPEAKPPPPTAPTGSPPAEAAKAKAEVPAPATKAAPAAAVTAAPPAAADTAEPEGEPDAKKAKTTDQDTLSRMLVQGVVRILQGRQKENKGDLLVNDLPEEFKTLWKVPFNLLSAGYTDVNTFLKAWTNKVEVTSTPNGEVVSLAKKAADKAKAEPAKAPAATKSSPPAVATDAAAAKKAAPAKPSAPALPQVPAVEAAAASAAAAPSGIVDINAPVPSTGAELRKELARNAEQMEALAKRQKVLLEALNRTS
jgi:hypothetical protein